MSRRSPLENPQASVPVENSGLSESADRPAKPKAIGELAPPGPPTTTGTEAGVARGRSARSIALLAGVGLLIVLGVAPLSELVYSQSDRPAGLSLDVSTGAGVPVADAGLRDLPAGLPTGVVIRTVDDVRPYAVQALGRAGADALLAILGSTDPLAAQAESYPYRYSSLESVLDAVPAEQLASGGTALGAALTMLAAQPQPEHSREQATVIDNAGPAAFTVLNRTRASGQCAPQLDMLLLLAGDFGTDTPLLEKEQRLTEAACGDDVTPGWLVGQGQLRRVLASDAVSTMQRVVARHPSNIVALTGLGDANLGAALSLDGKPFTARYFFRESVAAYNRAVDHGGRRDAAPGLARALIGLGEPERAIGLLTSAARSDATPGPVLEVLTAAQEAAHRFGDAERTARRLATLGASAYPRGAALIPDAELELQVETLRDLAPALSLGADRLLPLRTFLSLGSTGGATTGTDFSFIPEFRDVPGLTGTRAACASWAWRRDAVLAGHVAAALADWSTSNGAVRPDGFGCTPSDIDPTRLRAVAEFLGQGDGALEDPADDGVADDWQNLLRWTGDLPAARRFAVQWQDALGDGSELAALRLGEIAFLQHHYDDAAAALAVAARQARLLHVGDDLTVGRIDLDRAAALIAAERPSEAEATLRRLIDLGIQGFADQMSQLQDTPDSASEAAFDAAEGFAAISYHASAQLADVERETGRLRAATDDYDAALSWPGLAFNLEVGLGLHYEVLDNNAAIAHLQLNDTKGASQLVDEALRKDPRSPVTLMTAGFIADRGGDVAGAMRRDRQALDNDPGLYPAANDLGVELVRLGRSAEARSAFRQAVGARPDYALGWFNLGVLESSSGPVHLLDAQHALATAYRLDPALRERHLTLTIDGRVYRTALDLSKPLPPAWTFADLQRPAPAAAVGLLALVGVGLGMARGVGRGAAQSADKWLDPVTRRLEALPLIGRARSPAWAIAATVTTFMLAALRHGTADTVSVLYPLGLLVLAVAAMSARDMVGVRAGVVPMQRSWGPGIVVGIAAGAAGYPWAPLPVIGPGAEDAGAREVGPHLAAPLTLAGVALVLFVESAWTRIPLAQAWAVASLIMCASLLLPVGPLDGAHLGRAGMVASLGVIGTALLLGMGLL